MVVEAAGLFLSVFVLSRQAPNCSKSQGISMDGYLPFRFARRSPLTVDVNPLQLPEGLERHPSRPLHAQPDGFREAFDSKVFLYDGFPDAHGWVRLVGPPFLNLLPLVRKATIKALPSGKECTFKVRELDRHGQLLVRVPDGTLSLEINLDGTICHAVVSPSELDIFADRRVMLTLSRNNPLSWIKDWLRFGRDVHGADAALIYDNGSTDYSVAELAAALEELEGFHAIRIVMWPFRYGPQGLPDGRFWDSDFCQSGALEHARHRFLAAARSVQNSDVDETVVSPRVFRCSRLPRTIASELSGITAAGSILQTPIAAICVISTTALCLRSDLYGALGFSLSMPIAIPASGLSFPIARRKAPSGRCIASVAGSPHIVCHAGLDSGITGSCRTAGSMTVKATSMAARPACYPILFLLPP